MILGAPHCLAGALQSQSTLLLEGCFVCYANLAISTLETIRHKGDVRVANYSRQCAYVRPWERSTTPQNLVQNAEVYKSNAIRGMSANW